MSDNTYIPPWFSRKFVRREEYAAALAALDEARKTLDGIADAEYRKWGSETGPEDFVDWARSRARHTLDRIDALRGGAA